MSEPGELNALGADYDISEASGQVSRAGHDIVELLGRAVKRASLRSVELASLGNDIVLLGAAAPLGSL